MSTLASVLHGGLLDKFCINLEFELCVVTVTEVH